MKLINRYKKIPVQARASAWYTVCSFIQRGISFFVIPIYTRLLSTEEYGIYSVFQSWREIIMIFATFNLSAGVFTKAMVDYENDRDRYTASMQGLSTIITISLFGIYLCNIQFWNTIFELNTFIMIMLFVYYLVAPALNFWTVRQRVEYRYVSMVVVTLFISVATPAISIYMLLFTNLRENSVILGFLFIQILCGLAFYVHNFINSRHVYDKEYWGYALKYNIPLIPHYLSLIVLGQADRIMIKKMCGNDKSGIYSLAYQVSLALNVVITAINSSLVPWLYECFKKKDYTNIKKVSNSLCVILVVMSLGVILIAPEIVLILGTNAYLEAIWVIPAVAISGYFMFCYGLYCAIEFYYGFTKYVMVASISGAALNVILNFVCIPRFGFIAAGYTTLVCYLVFLFMHYYFMRKICRLRLNGMQVFDIRFINLSCVIIGLLALVCMMLYDYWYMRYLIVLLIIIGAYFSRNRLKRIVQNISNN